MIAGHNTCPYFDLYDIKMNIIVYLYHHDGIVFGEF